MPSRRERANAIRALSMDAVQKANSGHPGAPMGMADIAEVLWRDYLKHNPSNPSFADRDRFVLSNGHGSMLNYSLLHLTGYDLSIDDLKNFRQLHSRTPGHPELGYTPGVETTTGPLGQGLANAVGFALAEKVMGAQFNRPGHNVVDHHTYVFLGNAFHHAAITHENVGVVVDNVMAWTVELRAHDFFGQGEAHSVGQTLTQRASSGFNARRVAQLRVARGTAVQLTEVFQVFDRQVIAGQVQQRVNQHRTVAVGQHEAVTVSECRVARVVLQIIAPQYFGDIRHTHRGTGMAAVGFLHGIHAECTNGVGTLTTAGHRCSPRFGKNELK